jgi:signal transduction histidine kinase
MQVEPAAGAAPRVSLDSYEHATPELLARPSASHIVQFYDREAALAEGVTAFLWAGLRAGEMVVVIATPEHQTLFRRGLEEAGVDVVGACATGQLRLLDARRTLSTIMSGETPDPARFVAAVEPLIAGAPAPGAVRAYGEMVDLLWKEGKQQAALRLEELWSELARRHTFALLCGYMMGNFYQEADASRFHQVCGAHSHVVPPESYAHLRAEIEERKQVEQALRRSVADLQRVQGELERAAGERERLIEELSQTVRFSEMFVGVLGHDLRNPLSAISTAAAHLLRRVGDEKVARTVGRIVSSSERMARMIDQLLDFTRVRLGRGLPLALGTTDLAEVCRVALDELEDQRGGCAVDLDVVGDAVGHWDVDRLGQLVSNLLGNALRHGTPGQPVAMRIDGTGEQIRLEVVNGGAIRPEILPVIFEPFRTTPDRKEAHSSGLGLGLFISRQIALAHGGSIEVKSSEEEGTRFTVIVPRRAAAGPIELVTRSLPPRGNSEPATRHPGDR